MGSKRIPKHQNKDRYVPVAFVSLLTVYCVFGREEVRVHVVQFEHLESLVILKLIVVLDRWVSLYWAQIELFIVLVALFQESIKLSNTNS